MALTDVVFINLAFAAAYWVRYDLQWFRAVDPACHRAGSVESRPLP